MCKDVLWDFGAQRFLLKSHLGPSAVFQRQLSVVMNCPPSSATRRGTTNGCMRNRAQEHGRVSIAATLLFFKITL